MLNPRSPGREPEGEAIRRFVILAAPRTGSNMLCTLLNSHPSILCHHELFNPRGIFVAGHHRGATPEWGSLAERDEDPMRFLARVWRAPGGASHVGFKMTRGQDEAVMRDLVRDPDVLKIVLRRSNRLKSFVSYLIAELTLQWESYEDTAGTRSAPRIALDPAALEVYSQANEAFYAGLREELEATGQSCLELRYEDLLSRHEQVRTLTFLGLPPPHPLLEPATVRQGTGDLRATLANFDVLDEALRGTTYHGELHALDG